MITPCLLECFDNMKSCCAFAGAAQQQLRGLAVHFLQSHIAPLGGQTVKTSITQQQQQQQRLLLQELSSQLDGFIRQVVLQQLSGGGATSSQLLNLTTVIPGKKCGGGCGLCMFCVCYLQCMLAFLHMNASVS
jgi:hypothetical protein